MSDLRYFRKESSLPAEDATAARWKELAMIAV